MNNRLSIKDIPVDSWQGLAEIVTHNLKTTVEIENRLLKENQKLRKRLNRMRTIAVIFGAITWHRISELELKIDKLTLEAEKVV